MVSCWQPPSPIHLAPHNGRSRYWHKSSVFLLRFLQELSLVSWPSCKDRLVRVYTITLYPHSPVCYFCWWQKGVFAACLHSFHAFSLYTVCLQRNGALLLPSVKKWIKTLVRFDYTVYWLVKIGILIKAYYDPNITITFHNCIVFASPNPTNQGELITVRLVLARRTTWWFCSSSTQRIRLQGKDEI